jgi:hypothetical protein
VKKRVAILIPGLVRSFEKTYQNLFENIIQNNQQDYEFDIFLDIWDLSNSKVSEFDRRGINSDRDYRENTSSKNIDCNLLKEVYNPTYIGIEKSSDLYFSRFKKYQTNNIPMAVFSQFYKIHKCIRAVNDHSFLNDKNYDVFIRTRFDLETDKINLNEFSFDKIDIYSELKANNRVEWIQDRFFIMNLNGVKSLYSFYLNLEKLMIEYKTSIPEVLLYHYLKQQQRTFKESNEIGFINLR